jgi:ligand-binding SRPBCC domain-containing protein
MPEIHFTTYINSPCERVFNLCCNSRLLKNTFPGKTIFSINNSPEPYFEEGNTITWQDKIFFKIRKTSCKIEEIIPFQKICSEQTEGSFSQFRHEQYFKEINNGTILIDKLFFDLPYGVIGKIINRIFLETYLKNFLDKKNRAVKEFAESSKWESIIKFAG